MTLKNPKKTPEAAAALKASDPNPEAAVARCYYQTNDGTIFGLDIDTDQITESNPLPGTIDYTKAVPTIKVSSNRRTSGIHPRYINVSAEGTGTVGGVERTFTLMRKWYICTSAAFDAIKIEGPDADTVTLGDVVYVAVSKVGEVIN